MASMTAIARRRRARPSLRGLPETCFQRSDSFCCIVQFHRDDFSSFIGAEVILKCHRRSCCWRTHLLHARRHFSHRCFGHFNARRRFLDCYLFHFILREMWFLWRRATSNRQQRAHNSAGNPFRHQPFPHHIRLLLRCNVLRGHRPSSWRDCHSRPLTTPAKTFPRHAIAEVRRHRRLRRQHRLVPKHALRQSPRRHQTQSRPSSTNRFHSPHVIGAMRQGPRERCSARTR